MQKEPCLGRKGIATKKRDRTYESKPDNGALFIRFLAAVRGLPARMSLAWRNEGQPLGPSGHGHPGSDLSGRPRGGCLADCGIRVCRAAPDRREPPVSAECRRRGRDRGRARWLPLPAESRGGGPVRDGADPGRAVSLRARPGTWRGHPGGAGGLHVWRAAVWRRGLRRSSVDVHRDASGHRPADVGRSVPEPGLTASASLALTPDEALTRTEMPDDWVGHPQRKDYPLGGIPVEYRGATILPPDERRHYA